MKPGYRIAIVGAGPVGQILAVFFREAGCKVAIVDADSEKIRMIKEHGIELNGVIQKSAQFDHTFTSVAGLAEFKPDLAIIAVKIYHTGSVIAEFQKLNLQNTVYLCAQNGIGSEEPIAAAFDESNVLRMVINYAGNLQAPNVTTVTFFNPPNYLASVDDSQQELVNIISESLTQLNLDTEAVNSFWLQNKVWEKTTLNAALSALCGITGLTMHGAMSQPGLETIVEQLIEESIQVAKAEEIFFEQNFTKKCLRYLRNSGNHYPSLAIDMKENRPTEVDFFNGQFVRFGRKHYVKTPMHFMITNLVKARNGK